MCLVVLGDGHGHVKPKAVFWLCDCYVIGMASGPGVVWAQLLKMVTENC